MYVDPKSGSIHSVLFGQRQSDNNIIEAHAHEACFPMSLYLQTKTGLALLLSPRLVFLIG